MNNDAVDKFIYLMKLNGKHILNFANYLVSFRNLEGLFCVLMIRVIDFIYISAFLFLFSSTHLILYNTMSV